MIWCNVVVHCFCSSSPDLAAYSNIWLYIMIMWPAIWSDLEFVIRKLILIIIYIFMTMRIWYLYLYIKTRHLWMAWMDFSTVHTTLCIFAVCYYCQPWIDLVYEDQTKGRQEKTSTGPNRQNVDRNVMPSGIFDQWEHPAEAMPLLAERLDVI